MIPYISHQRQRRTVCPWSFDLTDRTKSIHDICYSGSRIKSIFHLWYSFCPRLYSRRFMENPPFVLFVPSSKRSNQYLHFLLTHNVLYFLILNKRCLHSNYNTVLHFVNINSFFRPIFTEKLHLIEFTKTTNASKFYKNISKKQLIVVVFLNPTVCIE